MAVLGTSHRPLETLYPQSIHVDPGVRGESKMTELILLHPSTTQRLYAP